LISPGVDATRTAWAATSFDDRTVGCSGGGGFGGGGVKHLMGRDGAGFGADERMIFICDVQSDQG
jgi:hypothetical protein